MKYKDITPEQAREICKKFATKTKTGAVITNCNKCPLRRERKDEKGKLITLVCFYRIQELLIDIKEEYDEVAEEEIKHYNEL